MRALTTTSVMFAALLVTPVLARADSATGKWDDVIGIIQPRTRSAPAPAA